MNEKLKSTGSVPGSIMFKSASKSALSSIVQASGCVASINRPQQQKKHTVYVTDKGFDPVLLKAKPSERIVFKIDNKAEKKFIITVGDEESKLLKAGDIFESGQIQKETNKFECQINFFKGTIEVDTVQTVELTMSISSVS